MHKLTRGDTMITNPHGILLFHCHPCPEGVYEGRRTGGENPKVFGYEDGTVDALAKDLASLGIEKAVAFAPWEVPEGWAISRMPFEYSQARHGRGANEWLYQELKKHRDILGFVTVNPRDIWATQVVEEYINRGFVGVKVHPPIHRFRINDPLLDNFYSAIDGLGVPLVIHTGVSGRLAPFPYHSMPILVDEVAKNHPRLQIVIAHAGGAAFCRQALAVAQSNRNCYLDLSATIQEDSGWYIPREEIMLLIKLCGSGKIIYGSDWPWGVTDRIRKDIQEIRSWDISEVDKENILGGTFERLMEQSTL